MGGETQMAGLGRELEGMLVVSIEQAVAAPYCGMLLADAGARVVKVERKGGDFARAYDTIADGHSAYFAWLNAGKESIVMDIDDTADRSVLEAMLARADVFLHNLSPGALDRRGFDGETLRKINPGLVTCEITGYGRTGPYATAKAYDMLVQAETGLCGITGTEDGPSRVGLSICDIATGLTAFSAILRALLLRGRTGRGSDLSIAMFDVLADWMNVPLLMQAHLGRAPRRLGVDHANLCPYGAFPVADGEEIIVAIQSNAEWRQFCTEILGDPALGEDPRFATNSDRLANRDAVRDLIEAVFHDKPKADLLQHLREKRIACGSLNSLEEVLAHPQLNRRTATIDGADIALAALPLAGALSQNGAVPALDADGAALRTEFSPAGSISSDPAQSTEKSHADL